MDVFTGVDQSLQKPAVTVLSSAGHLICAETLKTKSARGARRLLMIEHWLREVIGMHSVLGSTLEGPSLDSEHREFDLGEISGVTKLVLLRNYSSDPLVVEPARLKKFTTGNGRASKEDMIHDVKRHWGFDAGDDDDIADSYALARIAYSLKKGLGPRPRRCEAEVIRDILHPEPKEPKRRANNKDNV